MFILNYNFVKFLFKFLSESKNTILKLLHILQEIKLNHFNKSIFKNF